MPTPGPALQTLPKRPAVLELLPTKRLSGDGPSVGRSRTEVCLPEIRRDRQDMLVIWSQSDRDSLLKRLKWGQLPESCPYRRYTTPAHDGTTMAQLYKAE